MSAERQAGTVILRHISGVRRGRVEVLDQESLHVVRGGDLAVDVVPSDQYGGEGGVAILHRAGPSYELQVIPGGRLWVNGQRIIGSRMLKSGDLIEVGQGGPVFRFRLLPPGVAPKKTLAEAFADSINGARADGASRIGMVGRFFASFTHDLATQTTFWFRVWMLILISVLVLSVVILVMQSFRLQKQLSKEVMRIDEFAQVLKKSNQEVIKKKDWAAMREEMEKRLRTLEQEPSAMVRAFEAVQESVAFVQGAFGFIEPESGRPLRYIESPEGLYLFTLEEVGPEVELPFTGTAFVASAAGVLLTNKHVAEPWLADDRISVPEQHGLQPVIRRIRVFFPGSDEPMDVTHLSSSEDADLALLKVRSPPANVRVLELDTTPLHPGDEVLVVGYPLGLRGMLARATAEFAEQLTPDDDIDFWVVAERLAAAGYVKPLASRGIVSQLSDQFLVYDAETTAGGSGGPVLNREGRVVAINTAIVRGFGGSNLGVLATHAKRLLSGVAGLQ